MMNFLGIAGGMILFWIVFGLIIAGISIFIFVFWISMIIDCVKRKFREDSEKIVWILVLIFTGIIGALIYYFIVKKK